MAQDDFNREIHGVSNFSLRFGLWYVRHKIVMENVLIGLFVTTLIFLYGYTIWTAVRLVIFEKDSFQEVTKNLSSETIYSPTLDARFTPKPVTVSAIKLLPTVGGRTDALIYLQNPNSKYVARNLSYRVLSGSQIVSEGTTHLWPGQSKYVVAFNIAPESTTDLRVDFPKISWKRTANFAPVLAEREHFTITHVEYLPPQGAGGRTTLGTVRATVMNQSIYNFWEASFYIFLYNGADIVGAGFMTLPNFDTLTEQTAEVGINNPTPFVTNVSVVPEVNILDESLFHTKQLEVKEEPVNQ